jgi:predicted nucleotidyltransferase
MSPETLRTISQAVEPVLKKNDVEFAAIFGSFSRQEQNANSDIDVVIRYAQPTGLFALVGLSQELSALTGRRVAVVSEKAIHTYLRPNMAKNLHVIYGQRQCV